MTELQGPGDEPEEALDSLTGLLNRRGLMKMLAREVGQAREAGTRLSLIVLDVDNFKRVNDEFGYLLADAALKNLADCLRQVVRPDVVGRIGGDEFVVVLPGSTFQDAMELSSRLNRRIADQPSEQLRGVTVSFGSAELADGGDLDGLFSRADDALHRGKQPPHAEPSGAPEPRRPTPSGGSAPGRRPFAGSADRPNTSRTL